MHKSKRDNPQQSKDMKTTSNNKDILLSMYNQSLDFHNFFQNWKQSTFDPDNYNPSKFIEEKADKIQQAMSNNLINN